MVIFKNLWSIYGPNSARMMVALARQNDYRVWRYLKSFWNTERFNEIDTASIQSASHKVRNLIAVVELGIILQLLVAFWFIYSGAWEDMAGGVAIGLAIAIVFPIVWAHGLAVIILLWKLLHPKRFGKEIVCSVLENQVIKLRRKHDFTLIAVVGSVGKTSTKLAIAKLLSQSKEVMYQEGNYNDRVTVPLVLFGQSEPNLLNIFAWVGLFSRNRKIIKKHYPYEIAVVELGSDGPGQMRYFEYLQPDITVVTAITPEHMEFMKDLDTVAKEELTVVNFSKKLLVNHDDIDKKYLADIKLDYQTYGTKAHTDYYVTRRKKANLEGQKANFHLPGGRTIATDIKYLGVQGAKVAAAAVAIADMLKIRAKVIEESVQKLEPFAGRMQVLEGIQNSKLIDDTYNSSPSAARAALDVLYECKANQKIALLGNMNELGRTSRKAHTEIGEYCDPKKIDLVLTLGKDANKYLAPAAVAKGCKVRTFTSPYKAGEYIKDNLVEGAVVLIKGSQNGVFAEEATKLLLNNPADASKLVRQSKHWLRIKKQQFSA